MFRTIVALVPSQVTRVEDYAVFLTIAYNGQEIKGFLERDEAKVTSELEPHTFTLPM